MVSVALQQLYFNGRTTSYSAVIHSTIIAALSRQLDFFSVSTLNFGNLFGEKKFIKLYHRLSLIIQITFIIKSTGKRQAFLMKT